MWGAAPVLASVPVASAEVPLVWLAVVVSEEPSLDCAGVAAAVVASVAVAAASLSKPAVIVTGMKKSAVVISVRVTVSTPGSLAADPSRLAVHTAVCWLISQRWDIVLDVQMSKTRGGKRGVCLTNRVVR